MQFRFRGRLGSEPASQPTDALTIGLAIAVFALLSLLAAVLSDGFLNGDACAHYLFARYALSNPAYLVDVWGRPLVTGLYALPAAVAGRMGVRVTSLLVAVSCAIVAMRIARGQGIHRPALALIFTLAQPLLFLHSFSELTELPFALVVGLAFAAFQRRRWLAVALLAGLLPLARPEGYGFLLLAAVALVAYRRPTWLAALVLPLLGWEYAAWRLSGQAGHWWNWLMRNWPWEAHSLYGRGSIFSFVAVLPVVVGPMVLPATLIGVGCCLREFLRGTGFQPVRRGLRRVQSSRTPRRRLDFGELSRVVFQPILKSAAVFASIQGKLASLRCASGAPDGTAGCGDHGLKTHATTIPVSSAPSANVDLIAHRRLCIFLTGAIPLMVLAVHTFLYWQGKMASDGEARYLLIAAPFWGILSARGWEAIFGHMRWEHPLRWAAVAALAPVVANVFHPVVPVHTGPDWQAARRFADAYRADPRIGLSYPRLIASHPGIFYYLDVDPKRVGADRNAQVFAHPPPGTLLIWDPLYSSRNSDAARVVELGALRSAGWEDDEALNRMVGTRGWHIFRSPNAGIGSPGPGE